LPFFSLSDLFSPVTTQQQNTENILGITALIFFVGMLISLITIILQIMRSFRKKLLKRSSVLWISAATSAIIAILIGILIAINISFSNSLVANISAAVGLGLFVLGLESLLVFIIVGINMLVIYLSGLSSAKSNVSLP